MTGPQRLLRRLDADAPDFWAEVAALAEWEDEATAQVESAVRAILAAVRARGDAALLEYTRRFDGWTPSSASALELSGARIRAACDRLEGPVREALETAASRIWAFHEHQRESSWQFADASGMTLGQELRPLERVGLYVPGGKAAYPSSVLMNALPAKVAGVDEVVMTVPAPGGAVNEAVIAAAAIAVATYTLPGPTILSTAGTVSVP